ncbi:MAG: hypothetical protein ACYS5V_12670, partial [Planctomycetota bacterium]
MTLRHSLHLVIGLLAVGLSAAGAGTIDAYWQGPTTGDWNDSTHWSSAVVPANNGDTYNVFIDAGDIPDTTVHLDMNVTIDNVTVSAGDALWIDNSMSL